MIVDQLLAWWMGIVASLVGILPEVPPELLSFVGDAADAWTTILTKVQILDPLIPFSTIATCFQAVVIAYLFSLVVEVARIVISYFTFGGGAT